MIAIPNYFSADEYLQWEDQQEEKHEYIDGLIYAMAGASESHVDITTNLTVILANHLRGGDCKLSGRYAIKYYLQKHLLLSRFAGDL